MTTLYYNIFKNYSFRILVTVAIDIDLTDLKSDVPYADRACQKAHDILDVPVKSITAFITTKEQFLKTGL